MKIKRTLLPFIALCAAISVLAGLGGCTSRIKAQNLMVGIVANSAQKTDADGDFSRALAGFSLRLFSDIAKSGQKSDNILIFYEFGVRKISVFHFTYPIPTLLPGFSV